MARRYNYQPRTRRTQLTQTQSRQIRTTERKVTKVERNTEGDKRILKITMEGGSRYTISNKDEKYHDNEIRFKTLWKALGAGHKLEVLHDGMKILDCSADVSSQDYTISEVEERENSVLLTLSSEETEECKVVIGDAEDAVECYSGHSFLSRKINFLTAEELCTLGKSVKLYFLEEVPALILVN